MKESVKWCEENPDKDPLDCLKPQTPEQVADGLKEAFREAVKQGIIPEVDKVRDVFMNEMVEKQSKTLTDIVYRWWDDVFTTHSDWDMETSVDDLIDQIEQWLPKQKFGSLLLIFLRQSLKPSTMSTSPRTFCELPNFCLGKNCST